MDSNHTYLAVISLDSALRKDENYYPQVFLKEFKYIEKGVLRHIINDLQSSSDDSDEELIKDVKLMFLEKIIFENEFFEGAILKMRSGCLSSQ